MAQRRGRIVSNPDVLGGEPRVEGHRVGVLQLHAEVERHGESPQAVANRYGLDVAAVYRALAYYHENPREMADVREQRERRIEAARGTALVPGDVE
jgi:uncharacterized protein (DUF433 family)